MPYNKGDKFNIRFSLILDKKTNEVLEKKCEELSTTKNSYIRMLINLQNKEQ